MATGKCPFSGRNPAAVFEALQERQPTQIGKINPAIPSELIKITNKALQKDRVLRYQTAADMRRDLQALTARLQGRAKRWKAWSVGLGVAVISVALLLTSLRFTRLRRWALGEPSAATTLSEIKSLAVLPLENLTGDPTQEYFTDGMTDALITNLTKLGSLRVISRTSAMHYKGTHPQLAEVARTLGVGAVMEGSVVRSGDRVRVSVQLVDAANDRNIWARDYERDMRDVLQLQNEVASMVAQAVAGTLNVQEKARLAQTQTVRPEVYEAYLKGRYFSNRPNEDGIKKGIAFFQEAIRLDPNYAPAYAGLADAYAGLSFAGVETDRPRQLAIEAAKKAISLDDSLAEAHASLGWILHRHMQNWSEAEKEYRRAIELNPNYATVHRFYGHFLRAVGQDELACNENQLAHELDPLNTLNTNAWAQCVYERGHFAEAIRMVQDILEIDPGNLQSRWTLGEIYERHGMFPQAIAQYEKGREITHGQGFIPYSLLGSAYAGSGQTNKAETILREMNHKFGEDKWISATIHVRLGRKEQAIRELRDDNAKCGPGTCGPAASLYIWNWRFSPLYPDRRFQALLEKFHYPESAFRKIGSLKSKAIPSKSRSHS